MNIVPFNMTASQIYPTFLETESKAKIIVCSPDKSTNNVRVEFESLTANGIEYKGSCWVSHCEVSGDTFRNWESFKRISDWSKPVSDSAKKSLYNQCENIARALLDSPAGIEALKVARAAQRASTIASLESQIEAKRTELAELQETLDAL